MAVRLDLEVDQGTTFTRTFVWQNPDGSAVNLTGYSAKVDLRAEPGSAVLATFTPAITPATGTIVLTIPATSAAWTFKVAEWDLLVWSASEDHRLVEGTLRVNAQVTVKA